MITHKIMTLAEKDGFPVVLGADFIVPDDGVPFFVVYGPMVPGVNTRWVHPGYALLWEAKPGLFAVFAEESAFAKIDPTSKGKPMTEWKKTAANLNQWPTGVGWRKGASTSVTAAPTIPGTCGPVNLIHNLDTATKAIPP